METRSNMFYYTNMKYTQVAYGMNVPMILQDIGELLEQILAHHIGHTGHHGVELPVIDHTIPI